MTALDTNSANSTEETHVTTSYENDPNDLLFGMDCQMLGSNPDNCPISTSVSPPDPNSLNAFFQSIIHPSSNIFRPQPIPASSYHQLLHFSNEVPLQPRSYEQTTSDRFANAHTSSQRSSSIFENEAFQSVHVPFEFLPLEAAISSLADSTHIHSMGNHSGLYHLPSYYQNFSSQSLTQGQAMDSRPNPSSQSPTQETLRSTSSAVSALGSSQSPQGHDHKTDYPLQSEGQAQNRAEETQATGELDVALSSCALAETSSVDENTLAQSASPSSSHNISHSVAPASGGLSHLKHATLPEPIPVVRRTLSKNQKPSKLSMSNSLSVSSPKIKSKSLKRSRVEKSSTETNLVPRPDQLTTPSRPNPLANKKINVSVLPPTPDSLQRPKTQCSTSLNQLDTAEESGSKKKQKIESIERALEALDTLTEYLSQEANECSFNSDDPAGYSNQWSPHQNQCNTSLSLVSPQHFFTLGELGGRLRRRLDLHRR